MVMRTAPDHCDWVRSDDEPEHGPHYDDDDFDDDDDRDDSCRGGKDDDDDSHPLLEHDNGSHGDHGSGDDGADRRGGPSPRRRRRVVVTTGARCRGDASGRLLWAAAAAAAAAAAMAVVTLSWGVGLSGGDNDDDHGAAGNWLRYATPSSARNKSCLVGNGDDNDDDDELIKNPRPPLHELIADFHNKVTGNVSWLLDVALLGHGKCATTSHLQWLRSHPDILAHEHEVYALKRGQAAEMVSLLYALPNRPHRKRMYKSPTDIMNPRALDLLRLHWPSAKFVVGVRHPVRWFESYYNFHSKQYDTGVPGAVRLKPAEAMAVPRHVYFHRHLSGLGKTNVTDPGERALLGDDNRAAGSAAVQPPLMSNEVFLYESLQPYDLPDGRSERYRHDLEAFLGLSSPLPPIPLYGASDGTSYYNYTSDFHHYKIDVCDDAFKALRRQLLDVGAAAAEWILRYFVGHPDVTVSSPRRFEELLKLWSVDPCDESGGGG